MSTYLDHVRDNPVEAARYHTLKRVLSEYSELFRGRQILDFGASSGLSAAVLVELGAAEVAGVEPDLERVTRGKEILQELGYSDRVTLHHISDTANLPFDDGSMEICIANAVLEHIPQPRAAYIREIWRVLSPGGVLLINETPNKYLPFDFHTTGLFLVPWLPSSLARRYAIWRKRFGKKSSWYDSGWRGIGYYEITGAISSPFETIPEMTRLRHRILNGLGLPTCLLDPYPVIIFRKH